MFEAGERDSRPNYGGEKMMTEPNYKKHITMLPPHMRKSMIEWIESPLHPRVIGSFLRAVLENNLVEAFSCADEENSHAMREWVLYLYNYAPSECWGSPQKALAWHELHAAEQKTGASP